MHKQIPLIISKEQKIALRDFLTEVKYTGGWDDYIYDRLREMALNTKVIVLAGELTTVDKRKVSFTDADLLSVKIVHKKLPSENRTIFTVGIIMYEGLENSYRIQVFTDKKLKSKEPIESFEAYINDNIQMVLKNILLKSYGSELDKERKEIKEPDTPKTDKKQ